jgi:hypothetical protein
MHNQETDEGAKLANLLKALGGVRVTEIAIRMVGERELLIYRLCDVYWCIRADPENVEGIEDALTKDHDVRRAAARVFKLFIFLPTHLKVR